VRREELPFVRSFTRSFVRSFVVVEKREWQCGGKKVMTRGRRSKIIWREKKLILWPIGVWNLECIGTHCWRSVWAGAVLSSFQVESHLWPGLKSETQRVPRHVSPYCQQNSGYAGWFCPDGSVFSIPPWKVSLFVGHAFSWKRDTQPYFKFYIKKSMLPINLLMQRILNVFAQITVLRQLQWVAVFGLCASLTDAYTTEIVCLCSFR
jgi:hypothetical protein